MQERKVRRSYGRFRQLGLLVRALSCNFMSDCPCYNHLVFKRPDIRMTDKTAASLSCSFMPMAGICQLDYVDMHAQSQVHRRGCLAANVELQRQTDRLLSPALSGQPRLVAHGYNLQSTVRYCPIIALLCSTECATLA